MPFRPITRPTSTPSGFRPIVRPAPAVPPKEPGLVERLKTGITKRVENIADIGTKVYKGEITPMTGSFATVGQLGRAFTDTSADIIGTGISKLTPDEIEKPIVEKVGKVLEKPLASVNKAILNATPYWNEFKVKHPEAAMNIESAGNIGLLGLEATVLKDTKKLLSSLEATAKKSLSKVKLPTVPPPSGATGDLVSGGQQLFKEAAERIPTAKKRITEQLTSSAEKAAKIKSSEPALANAYKSNIDEKIINTVSQADEETKKAFKAVVDIAEETPKDLTLKKKPSIVSGDLASKQVDLIVNKKKDVGKQLGDKIKQLSKTESVDITDSFKEIDDVLSGRGVRVVQGEKGPQLDFSGSNFTPAERNKITELYNLTSEGGYKLTPAQIHAKDQLFSKLQREASMEGVGNIMVETPEGVKSLFSVFRDTFSKKLDNVSPDIRKLNSEYRQLSGLVDDIENSILKTPNFNATKSIDQAEFAKVNLRRIFGEAQSSPAFEAVADQMDALARQLGYKEASPKQVAEFAEALRKLYPESIPKTGFQGGIKTGIGELFQSVYKLGTPNLEDQRKALRDLLDYYVNGKKPTSKLIDQSKLFPPKKVNTTPSTKKTSIFKDRPGFAKIPFVGDDERDILLKKLNDLTTSDFKTVGSLKKPDLDLYQKVDKLKDVFNRNVDLPADMVDVKDILARLGKLENPLDNVKLPKGKGATTPKTALGNNKLYHVSDNPNLKISKDYNPKQGQLGKGLYVTKDPKVWQGGQIGKRPYVYEVDASNLKIADDYPTRGELIDWGSKNGYYKKDFLKKPNGEYVLGKDGGPMKVWQETPKAEKLMSYKDPMTGSKMSGLEQEYLKSKGYDGVSASYSPDGEQSLIFNYDKIKITPVKPKLPTPKLTGLEQEARKYKSAEEFVKAQEKLGDNSPFKIVEISNDNFFGKNPLIKLRANKADYQPSIDYAIKRIKNGEKPRIDVNDNNLGKGLEVQDGNHTLEAYRQLGIENIPVRDYSRGRKAIKSQLTDIWNKANKLPPKK